MSKYLLWIVLAVLIIFVLFINAKMIIEKNNKITELNTICDDNNHRIVNIDYFDSLRTLNDNIAVDKTIVLEDCYGNIFNFQDLFKFNKLVFRYTDLSCMACVENELGILAEHAKFIDRNNIIIITSYDEKGLLYRFIRLNKLEEFRIYNIKEGKLINNLDDQNLVYYLILDNELKVESLFIPDKSFTKATKRYLRIMEKKYFN